MAGQVWRETVGFGRLDRVARATVAVVVLGAVAVMGAACSDDGNVATSIGGDDDASPVATVGAAPDSPEELAVEAYQASNEYMAEALAARPPEPEDPELRDHFSGPALNENAEILLTARQNGRYYETTFESDPDVVTTGPGEVVLSDCVTETTTVFDLATQDEVDSGINVVTWEIRVVETDDGWRVDEITLQQDSCTP